MPRLLNINYFLLVVKKTKHYFRSRNIGLMSKHHVNLEIVRAQVHAYTHKRMGCTHSSMHCGLRSGIMHAL